MSAVCHAMDQGINHFDTAPFYGQGESERILGAVFSKCTTNIVVSTKVGLVPSKSLRMLATLKPIVRRVLTGLPDSARKRLQRRVQNVIHKNVAVALDPQSITSSVETSLRRLRRESVDILLLHVSPAAEQLSETLDVLSRLKQSGKIRSFGAGAAGVEESLRWLAEPIDVLQLRLNLLEIETLKIAIPMAIERQIGVIAREPFAHGRLLPADNLGSKSNGLSFMGESFDSRFESLREAGESLPQLSLRFLLHTKGIHSVLAGMAQVRHIDENLQSVGMPALDNSLQTQIMSTLLAQF